MRLRRVHDDGKPGREASLIGKARPLVIDELGFLPLDADGAKLLFQTFADAYKRRSAAIATNLGAQQVGVGVRGRPDGCHRDRPHRPPREARPVPWRVLPRPPCPHAGGLAAQKACAPPVLRPINFRCSFCSNPLDETHARSILWRRSMTSSGKNPPLLSLGARRLSLRARLESAASVPVAVIADRLAHPLGLHSHHAVGDVLYDPEDQLPKFDAAVLAPRHRRLRGGGALCYAFHCVPRPFVEPDYVVISDSRTGLLYYSPRGAHGTLVLTPTYSTQLTL